MAINFSIKTIFLGILSSCFFYLQADQILPADDAQLLSPLFKTLLMHSEAGYVFYDKKPVCAVAYFQRPQFFREISFDDEINASISCAKKRLEGPAIQSKNILFHDDKKDDLLLVINRRLFLDVVKKNLPLFQNALGPSITPESLLNHLLLPGKSFLETLNYDKVLIGIVLGFGTQNALFGSRYEHLDFEFSNTLDLPPLSPILQFSEDDISRDSLLFVDKEENFSSKVKRKNYTPTMGFSTVQAEKESLEKNGSLPSERLSEESPKFIFNDFEHDKDFIRGLEDTQRKIQHLLQQPDWFEKTLEIIRGEKVLISSFEVVPLDLESIDPNFLFAKLLREELLQRRFESSYFSSFAEGLLNPNDHHDIPYSTAGTPRSLHHLRLARKNLEESDRFFAALDRNPDNIAVLKGYLYYKVLEEGQGAEKADETKVSVDLDISDSLGNLLNNGQGVTLDLSETIPGFSHGLKGIKKKEQRIVYIHPALAYGVHTHLDKGVYLKAVVTVNKMEKGKGTLPALEPTDLSFVKSDAFFTQCEEEYRETLNFIGRMKAAFLILLPDIDVKAVYKYFTEMNDDVELSAAESDDLNRFLWNVFFAKKKYQ